MLLALCAALAAAAGPTFYRIELARNEVLWSQDRPVQSGNALLFHRYPGGLLVSVKRSEVRRIVAAPMPPQAAARKVLGTEILIGSTGDSRAAAPANGPGTPGAVDPLPGERKNGTALFNPDRPYRPEWDGRQVPGLNLARPASPNDYREGATFAHPPASALVPAPGDPPTMPVVTSAEPPKAPEPKNPQ